MRTLKIISYSLFFILLIGGIYIYREASKLENPTFIKLENIKFRKLSSPPNLKITFSSDAILNNPNDMGWTISKVEFDAFANGKKASRVVQEMEVEMPANSNFSLPLSFEIPLSNSEIIKNFKDFVTGTWKEQSLDIGLLGAVYVKALGTDFRIEFDYMEKYELRDHL